MDENQNHDGAPQDAPHAPPEMQQEPQDAPTVSAQPESQVVPGPENAKSSFGPIFGIIIIVILLVLAGILFLGKVVSVTIM